MAQIKYKGDGLRGLSIIFFRKFNNTIMREFTVLFQCIESISKKIDEKTDFFPSYRLR